MKKIKKHVEEWFRDIPDTEHNLQIKEDIVQNLEEKVLDLIRQGKDEEDAINKAIVDFGDIEDIKAELGLNGEKPKNRFSLHLGFFSGEADLSLL